MLTGWEIENNSSMLLDEKMQEVELLLKAYPLCAWDETGKKFWVIRKYHPTFQQQPDSSNSFRYCLVCYLPSGFCIYNLPHYTYTKLQVKPRESYSQLIISTDEIGTTTTNMNELSRKLLYGIKSDQERVCVFNNLNDDIITKAKVVIQESKIKSKVLGIMEQAEFNDWWVSKEIEIPYWNNECHPIYFYNLNPGLDTSFIKEADSLLKQFLKKTNEERINEVTTPFYNECISYVKDVWNSNDEEYLLFTTLKQEVDIWKYITLQTISIERDTENDKIYLSFNCDCDWDIEHGVELIYDNDGKFSMLR